MLKPDSRFFQIILLALILLIINSCGFKPSTIFYEIPSQKEKWKSSLSKEPIHIICTYYRMMRYDTLHKAKLPFFKDAHPVVRNMTNLFLKELCDSDVTLTNRFILYHYGENVHLNKYYELRHYEYVSPACLIPMYRAKHSLCIELRLIENGKPVRTVRHWAFTRTNDHPHGWAISDDFFELTRFSIKNAFLEMLN
jgi:hypothetical protein